MSKAKILCTLAILCIAGRPICAQDISNKGKDFYLCFPQHVPNGPTVNSLATLSIFVTSDKASSGTITMPNGAFSSTFNIAANGIQEIQIPFNPLIHIANGESSNENITQVLKKSIHVKVDPGKPSVVVYGQQWAGARSCATLVLPTSVLGKKYYTVSFTQNGGGNTAPYLARSQFQIIAVKDNTEVKITPRKNGVVGNAFSVTLPLAGDMIQYQSPDGDASTQDLTGTLIESVASASGGCVPVAVFSGSSNATMGTSTCNGGGSFDPLWQQMYPVSTWGKNFGFIPFADYPNGVPFRVMASEDNTKVLLDDVVVAILNAGEIYPQAFTSTPIVLATATSIKADKPICVAEYAQVQSCSGAVPNQVGDPDMVILNPIEQNISDIVVFSSNRQAIIHYWLNILIPTAGISNFQINGVVQAVGWQTFSTLPGYSYLRYALPGVGSFHVKADSAFNAIAYGFGNVESYAYSAGTNVRDLYNQVGTSTPYGGATTPNVCVGTPSRFKISLPYLPDSSYWDFNGSQSPNIMVHAPLPDSTTIVNGKQVYWFSLPNPYTYNTIGVFPVTVTNYTPNFDGCGTHQDVDFEVQVFDLPTASFTYVNSGCGSTLVDFTDHANPNGRTITKWSWNFGDMSLGNTPGPSHNYASAGSYTVKYNVLNDIGCLSDTSSQLITLGVNPVANFAVSNPYCVGKNITFSDLSTAGGGTTITKWYWNFGDGSPQVIALNNVNQVHLYAVPGIYTVTLKVETGAGCQSTVYPLQVNVRATPVASFSLPNACLPVGAAQFNDQSTISDGSQAQFTWSWNFGDGGSSTLQNPLHNYTSAGPFNVTLTVTSNNGCIDDSARSLATIYAQPHADFTQDSIESCIGGTTNFTDQSTANGSSVNQWFWNFGDGNTSGAQSPNHQYAAPGAYTVKLYVNSAAGCRSDTLTKNITVYALPTVAFSNSNPLCEASNVLFTSNSVPNAGIINQYAWLVNGSPQGGNSSTLNYAAPSAGSYTIKLSVQTDKGCSGQSTNSITVHARPVASFNLPTICMPAGIANFTSSSTISDGTQGLLLYAWNFGDGGNSAAQNPSHNYAGLGPYNVTLVVTSNNGCADDSIRVLNTINAEPQAAFTAPTDVCLGSPASFTDNSSAPGSSVAQWNWDFGDGTTSASQSPIKTYAVLGTYTVKLNIKSANGCQTVNNFAQHIITVNPLPAADFNTSLPACKNRNVSFTDASVANAGNIVKWTWDYGDGSNAALMSGAPFNHVYSNAANYNATLTVQTDKGCSSTLKIKPVIISILPTAAFSSPIACSSDPAAPFNDGSQIASGNITSWNWNFGDPNANGGNPNTSLSQNPTHGYTVAGNYTATLVVTSNNGCTDTISHSFVINGVPVAQFNVQNGISICSNKIVTLTDASNVSFGSLIKLEIYWDFANDPTIKTTDNTPTAAETYAHTYPEFGAPATKAYTIKYIAYSGTNCVNSVTRDITLLATPALQFDPINPVCDNVPSFQLPQAQVLNGLPGFGVYSGAGTNNVGMFDPVVAGNGIHSIRYTFTGANGCSNYLDQNIEVNPTPGVNAGPDKVVLDGGFVTLSPATNASGPVTFVWSPPIGLSNPNIQFPNANPTTDMTYTLTVTSDKGCTATDRMEVKVLLAPVIPNIFSPNGDGVHDKWEISSLESYPGCTVEIYNRYGQLVFHSLGYSQPWDGTIGGKQAPIGTYYYIVDPKNGRAKKAGFVDIIR